MTDLELFYSATSHQALPEVIEERRVGFGLVHYDSDFDDVALVTGQPTRWLATRGTW